MKKSFQILSSFLLCSFACLANNEKIVFVDGTGNTYDNFELGTYAFVPCQSSKFRVTYQLPLGAFKLCKVDWYDAAFHIYQTTTTNEITLNVNKDLQIVACKVYYGNANCSGQSTQAVDGITLHMEQVGLTTPVPASDFIEGCTSPVSFSSSLSLNGNNYIPPANSYSLHWNLSTGWTNTPQAFTSNITPTATSAGNVSLSLTLNTCPYTAASPNYNVVRTTPAPTFSTSNSYGFCNGTTIKAFAINGICGASNYTYSIQGNPNCVFTSNSQQTLTTASTSINISFQQNSSYSITLSVKANYPNSMSSSITSKTIDFGTIAPQLNITLNCPEADAVASNSFGALIYTWVIYDNTGAHTSNGSANKHIGYVSGNTNVCVSYSGSCGVSPQACRPIYCSPAGGGHKIAISPNPSNGLFSISIIKDEVINNNSKTQPIRINKIEVFNNIGMLLKVLYFKDSSLKKNIDLSNLKSGNYTLVIYTNADKFSSQIQLLTEK